MILPEFWQFLEPGWWVLHVLAVAIVYLMGVSHGRKRALRELAHRGVPPEGKPPGEPSPNR